MVGTERLTLVASYGCDPALVSVPEPFQLRVSQGEALVSLVVIVMEDIGPELQPFGASYNEVLLRISASLRGVPGGFVKRASIDRAGIAALGRRLYRYPFESIAASLEREGDIVRASVEGAALEFRVTGATDDEEVRALGRGYAHDTEAWEVVIDHTPREVLALAPLTSATERIERMSALPQGKLNFRKASLAVGCGHRCHTARRAGM